MFSLFFVVSPKVSFTVNQLLSHGFDDYEPSGVVTYIAHSTQLYLNPKSLKKLSYAL